MTSIKQTRRANKNPRHDKQGSARKFNRKVLLKGSGPENFKRENPGRTSKEARASYIARSCRGHLGVDPKKANATHQEDKIHDKQGSAIVKLCRLFRLLEAEKQRNTGTRAAEKQHKQKQISAPIRSTVVVSTIFCRPGILGKPKLWKKN